MLGDSRGLMSSIFNVVEVEGGQLNGWLYVSVVEIEMPLVIYGAGGLVLIGNDVWADDLIARVNIDSHVMIFRIQSSKR